VAENVDNLVLAQLPEIRQRLDAIEGKIDELKVGQNSTVGVLMALGGYIRDIDVRVEHLEQKIGGPA
jgi:hypothetical protein